MAKFAEDGCIGDLTEDAFRGIGIVALVYGPVSSAMRGSTAAIEGLGESGGLGLYKGGSFEEVRAYNIGGHVHHMPANSASPLLTKDGPAIWMETADHLMTSSYGRGAKSLAYRQQQADLIAQGKFGDAIQMDINDIRSLFGNKYDQAIEQMLNYARSKGLF